MSESGRNEDVIGDLCRADVRRRIENFAGRQLSHGVRGGRSQSYDHCYNYFLENQGRLAQDMEKSCAVLGFYLASWGMYRGSSYILKNTNSTQFIKLVKYLDEHGSDLRRIDVHAYDDDRNIGQIVDAYKKIGELVLGSTNSTRTTLVTKIMIAVVGCVPAFDTYFCAGMKNVQQELPKSKRVTFGELDKRRLDQLRVFYEANRHVIDELHFESRTVRFLDGDASDHRLTRAKIIDMYAFDLGINP